MVSEKTRVAVLGGGIIGVCAASWLLRQGADVTIVERNEIGRGTSFGNAGCFFPSSVVPVSIPGNLPKVPRWLIDRYGPLSIDWRYLPKLAPWLLRFLLAGRAARVEKQATALRPLLRGTQEVYGPLLDNAGARDLVRPSGNLIVYRDKVAWDAAAFAWDLRRRHGVDFSMLENERLWEKEPALSRNYAVGVFLPDNSWTVSPYRLVSTLANAFVRDGGRVVSGDAVDFIFEGGRLSGLQLDGRRLECDKAVVAAGAYSRPLTRLLGDRIPLDTERGYHAVIANPRAAIGMPIMDAGANIVATPMEEGLRIAGIVEFAGLKAAPNWRRAHNLVDLANNLLPGLHARRGEDQTSFWMGFRPSLPDSMPVIGYSRRSRDVVYAFGHGHSGMGGGGRTGKLVSELVLGAEPHIPVAPFSPARFTGAR